MPAKKKVSTKGISQHMRSVTDIPAALQISTLITTFLQETSIPKGFVKPKQLKLPDLRKRMIELNCDPPCDRASVVSLNRIKPVPSRR